MHIFLDDIELVYDSTLVDTSWITTLSTLNDDNLGSSAHN